MVDPIKFGETARRCRREEELSLRFRFAGNVDVWVGGILEDQVPGGKVGPLFQCLLIDQFKSLRNGDRLADDGDSFGSFSIAKNERPFTGFGTKIRPHSVRRNSHKSNKRRWPGCFVITETILR